jgi:DNA-binding transcriptional regulator GbsR (MarR family)
VPPEEQVAAALRAKRIEELQRQIQLNYENYMRIQRDLKQLKSDALDHDAKEALCKHVIDMDKQEVRRARVLLLCCCSDPWLDGVPPRLRAGAS